MVITPASNTHQLGIIFQWPSQHDHLAKQADIYLASALEHGCADGLTDALMRLGWATSPVTVEVGDSAAFWLIHVRILLIHTVSSWCAFARSLQCYVVGQWTQYVLLTLHVAADNGACFQSDPSMLGVDALHFE